MKVETVEIPGVESHPSDYWKIRALQIDGTSIAINALLEMAPGEFRKILKSIRLAAASRYVRSPNHVKRCGDPNYRDAYEFRAHRGNSRLMFFYDETDGNVIVCTNHLSKASGNQNNAFKICHDLCVYYRNLKDQKHSKK